MFIFNLQYLCSSSIVFLNYIDVSTCKYLIEYIINNNNKYTIKFTMN